MSTKVSNVFTIATGENDPLKGFRSQVKTGGNAPGTATDEAEKQKADGLKTVIDRAEGRVAPKIDAGKTPEGKPLDKPIAPKEVQKQAEKNYLDAKANAKTFGDLVNKGRVAMPSEKQSLAGQQGADSKTAPDRAFNSLDPKVQPGSVPRQNMAASQAFAQGGKTPVAVEDKQVATDIPRARPKTDGAKTMENAVSQPKVSAQAGHSAAILAGQGQEKTKQLNPEGADNIKEKEFEEDDGQETSETSSESKARAASGELRAKLGGLQASLGGSSGGTDFETNANVVDPESSLDNSDKAEKLGLHRYTEMSKEASDTQLAAFEFAKEVEKALKKYVPLEKIVPNWKPDTSLVGRVLADTEKEIAAAQDLLEAMRTRGKVSPNGYGWAV